MATYFGIRIRDIAELKKTVSNLSRDITALNTEVETLNKRNPATSAPLQKMASKHDAPNGADKSKLLAMFVPPPRAE